MSREFMKQEPMAWQCQCPPAARLWRPHLCFSCCHPFEEGDAFHSDAPNVVYHLRCYIAEVKASAKVRSTSNVSQE